MSEYRIVWQGAARDDLASIFRWIADRADRDIARAYVMAIEHHVMQLARYPLLGRERPDLGPAIRSLPHKRRALIAYRVKAQNVEILRVAFAGQNLEEV